MFVSPAPTVARVAGIHWWVVCVQVWVVWMCVCRYEMTCPFEVDEPVYNSLLHPVIKVCKCVALWTISKKLIFTQHKHKITFNKDTKQPFKWHQKILTIWYYLFKKWYENVYVYLVWLCTHYPRRGLVQGWGHRLWKLIACLLCPVWLFATPWTAMGFSRQEYWSGLPFVSPGDLPDLGIELTSPALQADSLLLSHQESPPESWCLGSSVARLLTT